MNGSIPCPKCAYRESCLEHGGIMVALLLNECSNFSDLSVVEGQEQPEQYEIKTVRKEN